MRAISAADIGKVANNRRFQMEAAPKQKNAPLFSEDPQRK